MEVVEKIVLAQLATVGAIKTYPEILAVVQQTVGADYRLLPAVLSSLQAQGWLTQQVGKFDGQLQHRIVRL